jgi:RES domain-containing protein
MLVFRTHSPRYAALDPTGSSNFSGRWHSRGTQVVYTAEHASLAVLETLIHAGGAEIPSRSITRIRIPDDLALESAPWLEIPESQRFGDAWVSESRSAVLRVESVAVNRMESNFVLNPRHPDFSRIESEPPQEFLFDPRYFAPARLK